MEVWFLRHGEAVAREDWDGDDAHRPLSPRGTQRMERLSAAVASWGVIVDRVLYSPLVRAQQTARIIARAFATLGALEQDDRLAPGFGPQELRAVLKEHRKAERLLLVGHEPDFSRVISSCVGGGRIEMKTGSLACVELDRREEPSGTLRWLVASAVLPS